jgi:hypothetical protein
LVGTNALDIRGLERVEEILTGAAFVAGTNATEFVSTNSFSEVQDGFLETNEVQFIRQPLTAQIKFLQFRYWAGTNWIDSWSGLDLPAGVEISLGREPAAIESAAPAAGAIAEEEGPEVFRRIVYLLNSTPPANKVPIEEPSEFF